MLQQPEPSSACALAWSDWEWSLSSPTCPAPGNTHNHMHTHTHIHIHTHTHTRTHTHSHSHLQTDAHSCSLTLARRYMHIHAHGAPNYVYHKDTWLYLFVSEAHVKGHSMQAVVCVGHWSCLQTCKRHQAYAAQPVRTCSRVDTHCKRVEACIGSQHETVMARISGMQSGCRPCVSLINQSIDRSINQSINQLF